MNERRRSFTLIEVLIAIALILALVGTMYGFLFDILNSRSRALGHIWQETAAAALIKQLESDLATCLVGDADSGSGVRGDERQIRVLSRGVSASLAARGVDDPDVFGDLQFAEYRFDPANLRIEGRRGPVHAGESLPDFSPIDGEIHKVRFRYFDGSTWQTHFDSLAQKRLPVAIEVAIWCRQLPDENLDATFAAQSQPETEPAESYPPADDFSVAAAASTNDPADGPPPDRLRVIIIPDSAADAPQPSPTSQPAPDESPSPPDNAGGSS